MKSMKKTIAAAIAIAMIFGCAVGGTLAWLMAETNTVTNTFTTSDVDIELTETPNSLDGDLNNNTNSYQMVPGNVIAKDPTVTVKGNSEDCWLFVEINESSNLDTYISYVVDSNWTHLSGNVYYREVAKNSADQSFDVIGYMNGTTFVVDNVLVNTSVTKAQMEAVDGKNADGTVNSTEVKPTLTFTAYAVQKANIGTVTDAWGYVETEFKTPAQP